MSIADGSVIGTTQIINNGPALNRWNLVLLSDGYRATELPQFAIDAQTFVAALFGTAPFDALRSAINVFRVDVQSTESGADDPTACGGRGAAPATFFDSTFCSTNGMARLLTANGATALAVASIQVPLWNQVMVIVNSAKFGGSGGQVPVFSTNASSAQIGIHEMGHSAFGLADEYQTYLGCGVDVDHNNHPAIEPVEPNITIANTSATIKWRDLIAAATPVPTTSNPDCTICDPQASPMADGTVGAFEGAHNFHCGAFRPEFNCKMRTLGQPFCAVCRQRIRETLSPFMVPVITSVFPTSGTAGGGTIVVISGDHFNDSLSVTFGGVPASAFSVDSDTQITAISPEIDASMTVDVQVTTNPGTSELTPDDEYTFD